MTFGRSGSGKPPLPQNVRSGTTASDATPDPSSGTDTSQTTQIEVSPPLRDLSTGMRRKKLYPGQQPPNWVRPDGTVAKSGNSTLRNVALGIGAVIWVTAVGAAVIANNSKLQNADDQPNPSMSQAGAETKSGADDGIKACAAKDRRSDMDISVGEEGSTLRVAPASNANTLMKKIGDQEIPHDIANGRTLIREECRSGAWSRVRILAPDEFRDVAGWVPTSDLVSIKTTPDGRRVYRPSDFDWNPGSTTNHAAVVEALNTVIRQNPSCAAYDTAALIVSDASNNPSVDALCIGPHGPQHLVFTLADIRAGRTVQAKTETAQSSEVTTTLTSSTANTLCREATLGKLSHPSTADFSILDTTMKQIGNESRFSVGLTAKNSFGLELKLLSTCVFDGDNLTLNWVEESR